MLSSCRSSFSLTCEWTSSKSFLCASSFEFEWKSEAMRTKLDESMIFLYVNVKLLQTIVYILTKFVTCCLKIFFQNTMIEIPFISFLKHSERSLKLCNMERSVSFLLLWLVQVLCRQNFYQLWFLPNAELIYSSSEIFRWFKNRFRLKTVKFYFDLFSVEIGSFHEILNDLSKTLEFLLKTVQRLLKFR